jgi:hypothetical protein
LVLLKLKIRTKNSKYGALQGPVYVLQDGQYMAVNYDDTAAVPVTVLPGCIIDLKTVFAE